MELSVASEVRVFLLTLLGGTASGFIYDIFRIVRRVGKNGKMFTFFQDVLYWLLNVFLVFGVILYANYGQLRWFEFLGFAIGTVLYQILLSRWVVKFSVNIVNFFKNVIIWIVKIVFYPVYLVYKVVRRPFFKIKLKISEKIHKIELTCGKFCFKIKRGIKNFRNMLGK